jgi:hypothetical protein
MWFGSNWMPFDPHWLAWDSVCNAYHGGGNDSISSAWIHGNDTTNRLVFVDPVVSRYSSAERMLYRAFPRKTQTADFANYYFATHAVGSAYPDSTNPISWQINDDSSSHAEVAALADNEYHQSWNVVNPGPFKLVAKLRVLDTVGLSTPNRDSAVITIVLKAHCAFSSATGDTGTVTVGRFSILWKNFHTLDDTVMFMSDSLVLPHDMYGGKNVVGGLDLEVRSRRYITARIMWICVENLDADALLGGYDLGPSNTVKNGISAIVRDSIDSAATRQRRRLGVRLLRFYLADEPTRSQYAAIGYFNDSLLVHQTVTEFEGDNTTDVAHFMAQAHPDLFWRYVGGPDNGAGVMCDSGLSACEYRAERVPLPARLASERRVELRQHHAVDRRERRPR